MAVLARRNWKQLREETLLRLGNPSATGMSARVEYWLKAAYDELWSVYHHFEFDKIDTSLSLSTSTNELALPSDCFIAMQLILKSADGATFHGERINEDLRMVAAAYAGATGTPTMCARFGSKLYFDKKPSEAFDVELYYYRTGTSPDYSTPTSPETATDCDEHIIQWALRLAMPGLGRPDLGEVQRQLMTEWLAQQVRPATGESPLAARAERERVTTVHGGMQG